MIVSVKQIALKTSDDFVPSVEKRNSSSNQMHYTETLMIDTAPISQSNLFVTLSNSYQGNSSPVASSNRQSPTLFGSALSPSSHLVRFYPRRRKDISLTTKSHLNPLGIKCLTPIKMLLWDDHVSPVGHNNSHLYRRLNHSPVEEFETSISNRLQGPMQRFQPQS